MTDAATLHDHCGLIILAGEQLWPDVDALAQWGDHLDEVRVLRTEGQHGPGGPADRIRKFIRNTFPHISVQMSDPIDTNAPMAVRPVIHEWVDDASTKWILNTSGETRLMFAGAIDSVQDRKNITLVYREENTPWYEITRGGGTSLVGGINQSAADRFAVRDLLQVTWSDPDRDTHCPDFTIGDFLLQAAHECLALGRPWRGAFGDAYTISRGMPDYSSMSSGLLFEQFVGALIFGLGVDPDDLAIGVTLCDGKHIMQEVDIVVNCNGSLNVIDCKLTDLDSEVSAITCRFVWQRPRSAISGTARIE